MTRPNSALVLQRASGRLYAGAAALAVTCLMLLLAFDARAADAASEAPSIAVHYSEAAFGTATGTEGVYRKLRNAARKVCGLSSGVSLSLEQRTTARECYQRALADAVHRVDRPMLTSMHSASARQVG